MERTARAGRCIARAWVKNLGLYTNPYQYMGALGDEMHRAIRLVVDIGIHSHGMTREQAIAYMTENEAGK